MTSTSSSSSTSGSAGIRGGSSASGTASDPDGRPISVLIVDDQRLVRAGFRVILASEPGIGEAADGLQAIELSRAQSRRSC